MKKEENTLCPKNYGHFDQRIEDCSKCSQALLHQSCSCCKKPACAGWNDDQGKPFCCSCYKEKLVSHSNTKFIGVILDTSEYLRYQLCDSLQEAKEYIKTDSNNGFIIKGEVVLHLHEVYEEERENERLEEERQKKKELENWY